MPTTSPESNRPPPAECTGASQDTPPCTEAPVAKLLERMRSGDRDASAEFIRSYAPLIRRRIRWRLGPAMRRIFDSEEILSTLGRRIDQELLHGKIDIRTEREFWALISTMLEHTITDKARHTNRSRKAEAQSITAMNSALPPRGQPQCSDTINQALQSLESESDRAILGLWLRGATHAQTAAALELSPQIVRKRWQRILDRFRTNAVGKMAPR